jgi:diguanylate cyclase (GGDEF)-like protein
VRKRVALAGISEEGLALIPLLEANPEIEITAILTDEAGTGLERLERLDPELAHRYRDRFTADASGVLRTRGLVALIDAEPSAAHAEALLDAPDHGIQVTTPLIAKLLYAFGPVDATRKPELLHALSEVLESYNLTVDRKGLFSRILQMAVGSTGADRGSLMLFDPEAGSLRVEVAIGIEKELWSKIHVRPGEGVAGRAFADRRAILLHGKADRARYDVVREREDVESAISAPLLHGDRTLGVLNLSHARARGAFDQEDLAFVEQLAAIDAKILTRAEEYQRLRRDSAQLRAESRVRAILGEADSLNRRLAEICRFASADLEHGLAQVWLHDPDLDLLRMQASSARIDPLASPLRLRGGEGLLGWVARMRQPIALAGRSGGACIGFTAHPLVFEERLLGVLWIEGTTRRDGPDLLTERAQAIATTLSRELAEALRRARSEREGTRMAAITEASTTLGRSDDSAELHRAITTSAAMILEAEHSVLRLLDPASGRFQIRSYFGSAETEQQPSIFALEKELSMGAIQARGGLRRIDVQTDERLRRFGSDIGSVLVEPLLREGRVLGTLSVLGKVTRDPLAGDVFDRDDQVALARLAAQSERALERIAERERVRHQRRHDELTGLPNAAQFADRLEEEVARAGSGGHPLALVRVRIDGLADLLHRQREAEVDRLVLSLAQEVRAALREFDVVARTAPDTFEILVPEPRDDVANLLGPLARRAREAIRREPQPELFVHLRLEFGYALFPDEADSAAQLRERVRDTRITTD